MPTGRAIGKCLRRRRQEFLGFLEHVDAALVREPGVAVHVVRGNSATHETPSVEA